MLELNEGESMFSRGGEGKDRPNRRFIISPGAGCDELEGDGLLPTDIACLVRADGNGSRTFARSERRITPRGIRTPPPPR